MVKRIPNVPSSNFVCHACRFRGARSSHPDLYLITDFGPLPSIYCGEHMAELLTQIVTATPVEVLNAPLKNH